MPHTLVVFHAHPDDEALLTAGTMARAAADGHRVVLVVATAGEVGEADAGYRAGDGLGAARRRELERSAEILGVARVEVLGYADSGSDPGSDPRADRAGDPRSVPRPGTISFSAVDPREAAERLAAILREESADVLTTYDPNGGYGHPDHRQVHVVGGLAGELAGTPIVLEATINRDLMSMGVELATSLGYELPEDFTPTTFDDWYLPASEITHAVDVSAHLAAKRASMEAHESQTTSSDGTARSLSLFLALPDEYFALAFSTEWFVDRSRPTGDGPTITDVFDGLHAKDV
jgi:LmbE family N-acetylglucosaminyl deacetylase